MKKIRLGDIATLITKGTTPTTIGFSFVDTGVNFVKIESIGENGEFLPDKFAHITDECDKKLKRSQLEENDILFSIAGAIGRTAIVPSSILPANTNQALAIIRIPQNAINLRFVLYALQSQAVEEQSEKQKQGVAQLNLSLENIADILIPLVSSEKQDEIVRNLAAIDAAIALRKEQIRLIDQLVKSRFVELFGDTEYNEKNLPTSPMTELCEIIDGDRGKNYPKQEEFSEEGFCLFLNAKNVTSNGFSFENCMYITEEKDKILRNGKLSRGDVVLTTRGTIGNLAFYDETVPYEHIRINSGMVILRMKRDCITERFFIEQFKMQLASIKERIASGSAQPQLPISTMNKIVMLVPNVELQNQFAAFVEQTDKSKLEIQKSLNKMELLKKSLMQEYFG